MFFPERTWTRVQVGEEGSRISMKFAEKRRMRVVSVAEGEEGKDLMCVAVVDQAWRV